MTCVELCIACRYGDHAGHIPGIAPSPGMLGGFQCPCEGGCTAKPTLPTFNPLGSPLVNPDVPMPEGWPDA